MTTIITADYNGTQVFFQDDAYLNATAIAKHFNKLPNEWLRLESTQEYIDLLCEKLNTGKSRILKTTRGINGGTWLHRRLAVPFARWLNVEFAIWCDEQIEKILIGEKQPTQPISLTKPHQDTIKELVLGRVKNLPKEQQASIIIKQWAALKSHFGKSYKDIDDEQFTEAVSLLARLPLEGELINAPKTETTINIPYAGRWLVITDECDEKRTVVKNIDGKNCVDAKISRQLLKETHLMADLMLELSKRMRFNDGECHASRFDTPLLKANRRTII